MLCVYLCCLLHPKSVPPASVPCAPVLLSIPTPCMPQMPRLALLLALVCAALLTAQGFVLISKMPPPSAVPVLIFSPTAPCCRGERGCVGERGWGSECGRAGRAERRVCRRHPPVHLDPHGRALEIRRQHRKHPGPHHQPHRHHRRHGVDRSCAFRCQFLCLLFVVPELVEGFFPRRS